MKVIDLLNKIANGEGVPHFKIFEIEYFLNDRGNLREKEEDRPSEDTRWYIDSKWLNTEVEIIEEDKPALAREELENRIENALEFLETQYNTYPSGQMWREALKNTLLGKEADNVYEPFEEDKKINNLIYYNKKDFDNLDEFVEITTRDIFDKINEIIDKLNEGKE